MCHSLDTTENCLIEEIANRFYTVADNRFDYSHLEKFSVRHDEFPNYLEHLTENPNSEFTGYDFKMMMQENFKFDDSKQNAGLQLVDIVASCFTRAMNKHLQIQGWENLGKIFIKKPSQIFQYVSLDLNLQKHNGIFKQRNFFGFVKEKMEQKAFRNLLPDD